MVKFSSKLLALLGVPAASAFFVQPPAAAARTATALGVGAAEQSFLNVVTPDAETASGAPSIPKPATGGPIAMPAGAKTSDQIWDTSEPPVKIQGGALRTWSLGPEMERVGVLLRTNGNHIMTNIRLCQGPDNTPQQMDITVGKGALRPFKGFIELPGDPSSVFIRNTGPLEYPIDAFVKPEPEGDPYSNADLFNMENAELCQGGGSIKTYEFDPYVSEVKVIMKTDGRPLRAKVELIQGPNSIKESIEIYTEDGLERPFCTVLSTPGSGNTVRINNLGTVEFPLTVSVEPFKVDF